MCVKYLKDIFKQIFVKDGGLVKSDGGALREADALIAVDFFDFLLQLIGRALIKFLSVRTFCKVEVHRRPALELNRHLLAVSKVRG